MWERAKLTCNVFAWPRCPSMCRFTELCRIQKTFLVFLLGSSYVFADGVVGPATMLVGVGRAVERDQICFANGALRQVMRTPSPYISSDEHMNMQIISTRKSLSEVKHVFLVGARMDAVPHVKLPNIITHIINSLIDWETFKHVRQTFHD